MKPHPISTLRRLAVPPGLFLPLLLFLGGGCSPDPGDEKRPDKSEERSSPGTLALPSQSFPPPIVEDLRRALSAYEDTRADLAGDDRNGAGESASRLATSLRAAAGAAGELSAPTQRTLEEAARAAASVAAADSLAEARLAFGEVSRFLMPLSVADERLADDWHAFSCPMTEGFPKWMQPSEELENPYMGSSMPGCGEPTDWTVPAPATLEEAEAHAEHVHGGDIAYYTCSMHPSVKSRTQGTCPICSMDLVPVTEEEIATGVIRIDTKRRQAIGVRTARAERRPLTTSLRTVGTVVYDETRLADVTLKYRGWIGRLLVDEPGQLVKKGQILFTLYSPELYAAQEEYVTALESQRAARETAAPKRADYLVAAARQRLRLWDLDEQQIDEIAASGEPLQYLPIASPVTGHVIDKNVVAGAIVEPGMRLYRIAGLDGVWVEAGVYESELPLVAVGQEVEVSLPYLPGQRFPGTVSFVYPYLQEATRTGKFRVELANPSLELKPDMFANLLLRRDLGERLVVPREAVLHAGDRSFVFLDLGEGRLKPTAVETGLRAADEVEILSGLEEGDRVVTSGNFLVAAESRLKLAMEQWR